MRARLTRAGMAFALAAGFSGCDAARTPADPEAGVEVLEETVRLRPGAEVTLTVRAQGAVTYRARQRDLVTVSEHGRIRAVAPGITWVVAEAGAATDSVRVVVSLSDTPSDGIAFTLASDGDTLRMTGVSRIFTPMGAGRTWTQVTASTNPNDPANLQLSDLFNDKLQSMLILQLDSTSRGFRSVPAWTIDDGGVGNLRLVGREGAMVWVRDPGNEQRVHVYVPVGPVALEIDRDDRPASSGPATGSLVGRASFEAAGLIVQIDENGTRIVGQVATTTTNVYTEFAVAQRIQPLGGMRATVTGGPLPTEASYLGTPSVWLKDGGLLLQGGGLVKNDAVLHFQLWTGAPRVGDVAVGAVSVEELAAGTPFRTDRAFLWSESAARADLDAGSPFSNLALSRTGTFRITRYDAPGVDTYGYLEGTLTTTATLIYGGAPDATQELTVDIVAPIRPTGEDVFVPQPSMLTNTDRIPVGPGLLRVSNGPLHIAGRVVETSVTPVSDVPITLTWSGGSATVRTNADGEFKFHGINPGDYAVTFTPPAGYSLALGQVASYPRLNIVAGVNNTLSINLADAQGNGALRVFAGSSGTNTHVDGLEVRVRRANTTDVVATLITGADHGGMVRQKLPPGAYDLEYVVPAGYRLVDGQEQNAQVLIRRGLESFISVGVVRK